MIIFKDACFPGVAMLSCSSVMTPLFLRQVKPIILPGLAVWLRWVLPSSVVALPMAVFYNVIKQRGISMCPPWCGRCDVGRWPLELPLGFATAQALVRGRMVVFSPHVVEISGISFLAAWQVLEGWPLANRVGAPSCAIACRKVAGNSGVL